MKKNLLVCAAFFMIAFSFSVNVHAQNFVSDEDEFSVWFPITPGIENRDQNGVSVRTYLVSKPDLTMTIVVNGLPVEMNEPEERAIIYDCRMKNHVFLCVCGTKGIYL